MTSMSILRLLADTARIKDGSILFEGEDLTEVSKKKLREIRGDKIAMIFQDPMSSLNPLIPVGKQVSEMIGTTIPKWGGRNGRLRLWSFSLESVYRNRRNVTTLSS